MSCGSRQEGRSLLGSHSKTYGSAGSAGSVQFDDYVGPYEGWQAKLDMFFKITERKSSIKTELVAGFTNFVASSYMLVLVPEMVHKGGIDTGVSMVGFAVGTFVCSVALGLLSNLPIPSGPGLGSATFFAYSLAQMHPVGDESEEPNTRYILSVCFASGLVMTAIALLGLPMKLFDMMPASVKDAMPVGLGMLLALCGFQQIGLVKVDSEIGTSLGDVTSERVMLGMLAVFLMAFLEIKKYKAAYLIPMVFVTVVSWVCGLHPWPQGIMAIPPLGPWPIDLSLLGSRVISPIISIYLICLLDIAGISYSSVRVAGLLEKDGSIPNAYWIFVINGVSTMLTATMGTTPCIVFGEAFAGVLMGGKTGLTAIVMGLIFLATVPFIPIFCQIPTFASAPVLVLVGVSLLGLIRHLNWDDHLTALPSFFTVALMPYLHAVDEGIIGGLIAHFFLVLFECVYAPVTAIEKVRAWFKADQPKHRRRPSAMATHYERKLAAFRSSLKQRVRTPEELATLFNTYDQQNIGSLTHHDLARLAIALEAQLTPEEIERAVSTLDPTNKDGMVRFSEFKLWLRTPTQLPLPGSPIPHLECA